jgi:gas vesicle protein
MSERNGHSTLMISMMAGLAGAGMALLLAPRSGRETRARIKSSAADMKDKAEDKISRSTEKAREMKEKLMTVVKKDQSEFNEDSGQSKGRRSPMLNAWGEEV